MTCEEPRSPLASVLQKIATISDECVWIAMNEPRLLLETRQVMARMEPDFHDLLRIGRARISTAELQTMLRLLGGIVVEGRLAGLD